MKVTRLATALAILLAWPLLTYGQSAKQMKNTIKTTVSVMAKAHLRKPIVDRAFCERWIDSYLNALDPSKLYFLSTDISEFKDYESKLAKLTIDGETDLLDLVTERYKSRAKSALKHAVQRVDEVFDFAIDERISLDHDQWPASEEQRTQRWRLQLKYDLLVEKLNSKEQTERVKFVKTRYDSIHQQVTNLTDEEALGIYLNSFCQTADPHSEYLTQTEFSSFVRRGPFKVFSVGLNLKSKGGRTIVSGVALEFRSEPESAKLYGCELMAIRSQDGKIYNLREIDSIKTRSLIQFGLKKDSFVTLELYDEAKLHRFAVKWPRR